MLKPNPINRDLYTLPVVIELGGCVIDALIQPETELTGRFRAWDLDQKEWLMINGWTADAIEDPQGRSIV